MSKQDLNGVRTAQDLERKYDFASLLGLKKNIETQAKTLIKLDNELNSMLNTLIINLKDVLDSQSEVSLWFSSGIPTTLNYPYTTWTTPSDHYGDIYYDRETGYVYQYSSSGWSRNEDYNLVQAMALTNAELGESSNYERKVFFTQPTPAYSSGDWWIQEDGTLYICQLGKVAGLSYEDGDFIVSSKYTTTVAVKQDNEIKVLKGTVMLISENYVSIEDLRTGGRTEIAGDNITTGTIKGVIIQSTNYIENTKGMKINLADGTIDTKNTKWDQYGNILLNNNAKIITDNGLITNLQFLAKRYGGNGEQNIGWNFIGFNYVVRDNLINRDWLEIIADIPSNFTITNAYITLFHQPVYYSNSYISSYGYSRKIQAYKGTNSNYITAAVNSAYIETKNTPTEITGAFGSNGWTPADPNLSANRKITQTSSINIKDSLEVGKANRIIIQSKNTAPTLSSDTDTNYKNCAEMTGRLLATLNVIGYLKITP